MPVPAPLCMQDVDRGEVAPWGVCGHREGYSKAWPAVRMRGRGLIATFLLRFHPQFDSLTALLEALDLRLAITVK
jgi:hypothetical protein